MIATTRWTCRRLPMTYGDVPQMLAGAEALLEALPATGTPALRWFRVVEPALHLGASQKIADVDVDACRAAGIPVYQRASGGTAVLADADALILDIAVPRDHPLAIPDLTQSYRPFGEAWTAALRHLGLDATVVSLEQARADARDTSDEARLAHLACFAGLSPFEVVVSGRKIVGLAQVRRRVGALFQAAVQLRWVSERLSRLLAVTPNERTLLIRVLDERVTGVEDVLRRPIACESIIAAMEVELAARGFDLVDDTWTPHERALIDRLRAERYQPLLNTKSGGAGT